MCHAPRPPSEAVMGGCHQGNIALPYYYSSSSSSSAMMRSSSHTCTHTCTCAILGADVLTGTTNGPPVACFKHPWVGSVYPKGAFSYVRAESTLCPSNIVSRTRHPSPISLRLQSDTVTACVQQQHHVWVCTTADSCLCVYNSNTTLPRFTAM